MVHCNEYCYEMNNSELLELQMMMRVALLLMMAVKAVLFAVLTITTGVI